MLKWTWKTKYLPATAEWMGEKMAELAAMGELLIDFTPGGTTEDGRFLFEQNPGGGVPNMACCAQRLGHSTAFLGMVGDDAFGRYLAGVLEKEGVDTTGLRFCPGQRTPLALVHLDPSGDRSFSFYRGPSADLAMTPGDVDTGVIDAASMFHFSAVCLTDEPVRAATHFAAQYAKDRGKLISFDPNWRPLLWKSTPEAREQMLWGCSLADVLKVSQEEMELLTGTAELVPGAQALAAMGPRLVFVTLGGEGCWFHCRQGAGKTAAHQVAVADTTGCGDAFVGAVAARLLERGGLEGLTVAQAEEIARFAGAAGSLCATKRGGIPGMHTREQVEALLAKSEQVPL